MFNHWNIRNVKCGQTNIFSCDWEIKILPCYQFCECDIHGELRFSAGQQICLEKKKKDFKTLNIITQMVWLLPEPQEVTGRIHRLYRTFLWTFPMDIQENLWIYLENTIICKSNYIFGDCTFVWLKVYYCLFYQKSQLHAICTMTFNILFKRSIVPTIEKYNCPITCHEKSKGPQAKNISHPGLHQILFKPQAWYNSTYHPVRYRKDIHQDSSLSR